MGNRGGVIGNLDGDDGVGGADDSLLRLCGDGEDEGDDEGDDEGALITVRGAWTMNGARSSHVLVSTSSSPN